MPIFSDSQKNQERNYKKIYAIDWALANKNSQVWDGGRSRAFENMVFLHLYRNRSRVHYYLTKKKRQEVDFVVVDSNGNPALAVQVCLDVPAKQSFADSQRMWTHVRWLGDGNTQKDNIINVLTDFCAHISQKWNQVSEQGLRGVHKNITFCRGYPIFL